MAFPFQSSQGGRRNQIVAIDLGARTTKAIHLVRKGAALNFVGYTLQDAPIFEKNLSAEVLGEHLKSLAQALSGSGRVRQVVLVAGINDSLLRHADLPAIPIPDLRLLLKYNAKNYLQQELPDYVFDCHLLPPRPGASPAETQKKARFLVGGAKRQFLDELQAAGKIAGLVVEEIVPALAGPSNAFELAYPEIFQSEVAALVDIGFKNSTVSILQKGELALARAVAIGGDKLTSGLAEALGVSYAEAEGLKVGLPEEVQSIMQTLLMPLGRELRASIDFFEHQQDKTVGQVFISGGSARSPFIIEMLQSELMVPCKSWNPVGNLTLSLPPQQMGEIEQIAPQLTVAMGAAAACF